MAIDEELSAATRAALAGAGKVSEVKMFGGIGFMLNGNMVAAASSRGLLVRVGQDAYADALKRPDARPMIMRGRVMEGYVYVDPPIKGRAVRAWLKLACLYVKTLPAKAAANHSAKTRAATRKNKASTRKRL